MPTDIQNAGIYTDFAGLANLKSEAANNSENAKIEVARQFEALFIQSMLKSMRDATPGDSLTGSDQVDLYQDMYHKQLSIELANRGGIGIAKFIAQQLGAVNESGDSADDIRPPTTRSLAFANQLWGRTSADLSAPVSIRQTKTAKVESEKSSWDSPESFIRSLMPAARKAADRLKTAPEAVLAIAALETGWGKHVIPGVNGQSSNNLFGIKATRGSANPVQVTTLEYDGETMKNVRQSFRTYHDIDGSVEDFADFLLENPRYSQALKRSHDPSEFIHEIHKAGYATDPDYTQKATAVLKQIQEVVQKTVAIVDNTSQGS